MARGYHATPGDPPPVHATSGFPTACTVTATDYPGILRYYGRRKCPGGAIVAVVVCVDERPY